MKVSNKLCGAALAAVLGAGFFMPFTTQAAPTTDSLGGQGHINFTSGTTGSDTTLTDPGSSDGTTITDGSIVDPGDFGMMFVTPLEFGDQEVLNQSGATSRDFNAQLYKDGEKGAETQNFVAFKDVRPVANHSYSLSAQITQQFQSQDDKGNVINTLKGASLTYKNPWLANESNTSDLLPVGLNPTIVLQSENNWTETVIDNDVKDDNAFKGFGKVFLNFGEKATTAMDSVVLNVPNKDNVTSGDFKAVVTWTLSDTPAPQD